MSNYDLIGVLYETAGKLVSVRYSSYDSKPDGQDWIRVLANQQGYEDGLRMEFSSIMARSASNVLTLVVIASGIKIYSSRELRLTDSGLPRNEMAQLQDA